MPHESAAGRATVPLQEAWLRRSVQASICLPMKAIVNLTPAQMLQARLNQPRVSLEYLEAQEARHRRDSEAFFKAARKETSKPGPEKVTAG